jgi:HK97 gp10 family phage protein
VAGSVTVKLEGQQGLISKLRGLIPKVRRGTQEAVAEFSLLVETDAKLFSPVDTGLNRAEIHSEIAPDGLSSEVIGGTSYAVFLELGTRFQRAQPFLFPAFEKNRPGFIALLKKNTKLF